MLSLDQNPLSRKKAVSSSELQIPVQNQKYKAQRQSDERFNTEQRLKADLGHKFWTDLVKSVFDSASDFNKEFAGEVISAQSSGSGALTVSAKFIDKDPSKIATAAHDPKRNVVEWSSKGSAPGKHVHTYLLKLVGDTHVVGEAAGQQLSPEDIAKEIIVSLVGQ